MSNNVMLFACSKCFTKHPFEELSSGQQLCKECRGTGLYVKCTYCRSEFRAEASKLSTTTICTKCENNVKQFGKPSACEYCNIIAAFIGNKCQRCTNSERKYGPPVTCEQCKQKCAFDRKDDDKKVDGKLLCWLCTLSYKRALAKTKSGIQQEVDRRAAIKQQLNSRSSSAKSSRESSNLGRSRSSGSKRTSSGRDVAKLEGGGGLDVLPPVAKAMRMNRPPGDLVDPNSSDHVVAMTQLKEQMASLQKQILQKDAQLLAKDKMITELKAKHFTNETELRNRMLSTERDFEKKVETLSGKIKTLQKEVATLSKSNKPKSAKNSLSNTTEAAGSGGSGTDSPLP